MNNETISDIIGTDRTIGCAVELSAEIFTPGIVKRDTTRSGTWFGIGELDGSFTPRLEGGEIMENVAKALTDVLGCQMDQTNHTNTMTMGPIGLTGLKNGMPKTCQVCEVGGSARPRVDGRRSRAWLQARTGVRIKRRRVCEANDATN